MSAIKSLSAREIYDSRGNPTVEVDLCTEIGLFRAAVPSGASTGIYEALELRDGDKSRLLGKGVLKAVYNVNNLIAPKLVGLDACNQKEIDQLMVETLDGTKNEYGWSKSLLGANAVLAVSMAVCRAGAAAVENTLYEYIAKLSGQPSSSFVMPVPSFNVINGGSHAGNRLACQEFMILPVGASSFREAMQVGAEVYHTLKSVIKKKYGQDACNVGDEGGFAPSVQDNNEALDVLMEAIEKSGHAGKVKIGTDVAASEFYNAETKKYDLDFKNPDGSPDSMKKTATEMIAYYKEWLAKYPFVSIEDPFDQDDWEAYTAFCKEVGDSVQIVGDDLLVTNPMRVSMAIDKAACNALLLKVNQIGSVTEAITAAMMSIKQGWGVMVSHRSGETEDSFIADLVVGLRAGQIKTGAPCRSERLAKYNQLLRIEEELGPNCTYAGVGFRTTGQSAPAETKAARAALGKVAAKLLEHPKMKPLVGAYADLASAPEADAVKSLCVAFMKALGGDKEALGYLSKAKGGKFDVLGDFYLYGLALIQAEIDARCSKDPSLVSALEAAAATVPSGSIKDAEAFWKVFFPVGVGMMDNPEKIVTDLRKKRGVKIEAVNPSPISDPMKQILFTSNVLLGLPPASKKIADLPYSADFKSKLEAASKEPQLAWFDHPIQIGVEPDGNEILYGLKGLDAAVAWEKEKGKIPADSKMTVALSITCTHAGLRPIAKQYVEEAMKELPEAQRIKHLNIMLFSEIETDAIVDKVLKPALAKIGFSDSDAMKLVFGVEGEYGRHYSFLKAVLAIYHAFVDPSVTATFKIDIDQVFIQDSLIAETGKSMLDHFKSDLWGAKGRNWKGEEIELGMIAGALCNQKDWDKSGGKLFIPDVVPPKPDKQLSCDETIFFSGLPQAFSTDAEMMTKYGSNADVIQRIHVTGGTNGILVDHLMKHKPFACSWIGRAEDQSYIFSVLGNPAPKLGYVHMPGLIMRHDKEAFAAEAMEAARIGKMVGDYERMLFSEYTQTVGDLAEVKDLVDPFTGCFCIPIPFTTTWLRFTAKALGFVAAGANKDAVDFAVQGAPRVMKCSGFVDRTFGKSKLTASYLKEKALWDKFYTAVAQSKGDASIMAAAKVIFDGATTH